MTKISQYPEITTPDIDDLLVGTDVENSNATKNFSVGGVLALNAATNTTTTILSLANLNAAYPDSVTGFRVHCISITSGKLVYEKTSTGWVSYTITMVL